MKAVTITITEELDKQAAAEARRRGISKSELMREGLARVLPKLPDNWEENPWYTLAGFGEPGISVQPGEIEAIVYTGR